MIHLAGLPQGTRISRSELSAAADCPEQFLSKVLQHLTRAGLMISHRGNTGGFEIEQSHRAATLLEVVEAIEGPIKLNICLTSDHGCNRQNWCPAHTIWAEAQRAMLAVLSSANIAELARKSDESRQLANVIVFDTPKWN
jgi:Rrf2 family protein